MPGDDLLRFIGGPFAPSWWWVVLAAVLLTAAAAWVVGLIVWTLPPHRLRTIPVIRDVHRRLTQRRFIRAIDQTTRAHQQRALSVPQAVAAYSRALRTFLFMRTGINARYLHLDDISDGALAPAVPLLRRFHDAQFNAGTRADVDGLGRAAEELIRSWT